jgi:Fe2+ transport system protein FeoA
MNDTALRVEANGDCQQPFMCPLSHVRAGTSVRIKQLATTPEVTHRLREMGFCEEQKIRLLAQQANVICQVCNVRLGISTQLAEKIIVEPIHPMPAQHAISRARQAA